MKIAYGHHAQFPGWPMAAPRFLSSIVERESCTSATASPAALPREAFDSSSAAWSTSTWPNGERYHRNIFDVLRSGGVAVRCFSTLYALPFTVNRLLPERVASRALDVFIPRDRRAYIPRRASM